MRRLIVGAMLSASCAGGAVESTDVVRADSAGVRIVTSGAVDRELTWRFEEIGAFRDTLGAPWVFDELRPRAVVTDRAGRTYVLTNAPAIVRFGRDGRYERAVGRTGGAPGEMRAPRALVIQGDSLVVFDSQRGLVRWGPSLHAINDLPLVGALAEVDEVVFRSGGAWVLRRTRSSDGTVVTLHGDTTAVPPLLSLLQPKETILRGCQNLAIGLPPFFSSRITWSTSKGVMLANVGPTYDLRLYEGPRLIAIVRRPLPPRRATRDDLTRLHPEGYEFRLGPLVCTFTLQQLLDGPGLAAEFPQVHGLAILSDGTIWVKRSAGALPPVLDVFTADGAYAGTVRGIRLPLALLPNGELLVPRLDQETGGQHVVRMRVTR